MKEQANRDSFSSEEDEPVQLPALDNEALTERFRLTVVGRVFHTNGRSMEAFLAFMPKAFRGIGRALGRVSEVDVSEARVLVAVNVTKPLKFKKRVVTDNGKEVTVSLIYEKLYRFCFACNMISHEERDCPHLTENQKQQNKERRAAALPLGGRRTEEAGALVGRRERDQRGGQRSREDRRNDVRDDGHRSGVDLSRSETYHSVQNDFPPASRQVRRNLYSSKEIPRQEGHRNPVWQRIGLDTTRSHSRSRETSIHSSSGSRKKFDEIVANRSGKRRESDGRRAPSRRRESPLRIRSPGREEPSLENWRSSRRPPRHQSNRTTADGAALSVKDKGKGKVVVAEDDQRDGAEDNENDDLNLIPADFEFGSGSGKDRPDEVNAKLPPLPSLDQNKMATPDTNTPVEKDPVADAMEGEEYAAEEENGLSDWAEEEEGAARESDVIQCTQVGESIPSDWENLADEDMEPDRELTDEDFRLMQELENEMILDGLLENDDLLGEEMQDAEQEGIVDDDEERTISEQVIPISHSAEEVPATSQSPTSKRIRRSSRLGGPKTDGAGPLSQFGQVGEKEPSKHEPKKTIPRSPSKCIAASRKLKPYQAKTSPKKRPTPAANGIPSKGDNIPQSEVATYVKNKGKRHEKKALKPNKGVEESRISPEPPA
ncbi:unnamed protein product [Arabidopsis arenosa]|uniref:Zinc knuckle CX2CX4HX4C domain-containing protein n=1 Tax=Arabidopsis arenosa TaxID=38785 RepID=A0A8S2B6E2_ARAAE|nr:unnamed protein product [Arabidopsis arenosa]